VPDEENFSRFSENVFFTPSVSKRFNWEFKILSKSGVFQSAHAVKVRKLRGVMTSAFVIGYTSVKTEASIPVHMWFRDLTPLRTSKLLSRGSAGNNREAVGRRGYTIFRVNGIVIGPRRRHVPNRMRRVAGR
jgi:hypothetical protein